MLALLDQVVAARRTSARLDPDDGEGVPSLSIMDPAVAAVLGAALGASATVIGTIVTARLQAGREARERKQEAYSSAIDALIRIRMRRRGLAESGYAEIKASELPAFIDDLVAAQRWLSMLVVACGASQRKQLNEAKSMFEELAIEMATRKPTGDRLRIVADQVDEVWMAVNIAVASDI